MTNQAAIKFVKQLTAAFSTYPISEETKRIYIEKLVKWRMTQEQWDRALDDLIENTHDENLPQLKTIYAALKKTQHMNYHNRQFGNLYFMDKRNYSYCIRCEIKREDGVTLWVYPPWHEKSGSTPNLPSESHDIRLIPDDIVIPPEEIPTSDEVRGYVQKFQENIKSLANEMNMPNDVPF